MLTSFRRLGTHVKDGVRHSSVSRNTLFIALQLASFCGRNRATARTRALEAFQLAESPFLWKLWAMANKKGHDDSPSAIESPAIRKRYEPALTQQTQLTRSLVLKKPGAVGEKGVLLVQFEYNWFRLLAGFDNLDALTRRYDVILGTSWSPTDYNLLEAALQKIRDPVFVLASHEDEAAKLQSFDARILCPPILSACDWVNPAFFAPKPMEQRETDILMVANWAPFKRHFELFAALAKMPRNLKVVLIGQKERGYTQEHILQMANSYRVPQRLEIHESLPIEAVTRYQCDSRVCLILSRREGSCVAATEALFAGAALGMREGAHVGALRYVNKFTGMRLSGRHMARDLMILLEHSLHLKPREWAVEHLSCDRSLQELNAFIKAETLRRGLPWTQDLAPIHWRPYPTYSSDADRERLQPAYKCLHQLNPNVFGADLLEN
jgi:glycosyltransferase involved in cell wall biosynthesis